MGWERGRRYMFTEIRQHNTIYFLVLLPTLIFYLRHFRKFSFFPNSQPPRHWSVSLFRLFNIIYSLFYIYELVTTRLFEENLWMFFHHLLSVPLMSWIGIANYTCAGFVYVHTLHALAWMTVEWFDKISEGLFYVYGLSFTAVTIYLNFIEKRPVVSPFFEWITLGCVIVLFGLLGRANISSKNE